MRQVGQYSRLTAEEIAEIRDVYRALREAEARRREVIARHRLTRWQFHSYGTGALGKKPARAA